VQNAAEFDVVRKPGVVDGLIETGEKPCTKIVVGAGAGVHRQHRRVSTELAIGRRTTEDFAQVPAEALVVRRVRPVREGMIQHRIGEASISQCRGESHKRIGTSGELVHRFTLDHETSLDHRCTALHINDTKRFSSLQPATEERIMVPHSFMEYMITCAGAAGAMIGLLFVAISLRSDLVFGSKAPDKVKTLAGSSFTSLVNAFSLSILAIIPNTNIGRGMIFLSVFCLINTWRLHARSRRFKNQRLAFVVSTLNYLFELAGGITLLVRPDEQWIVDALCYVIFASFVIALNRTWTLIQSETVTKES
jgi:hypothetical protein